MSRRRDLLGLLADGQARSGELLAAELGVTRAAVWKQVQQLGDWGLEVIAIPGLGYRLGSPLDLLTDPGLRARLGGVVADRLRHLEMHDEINSTNDRLLEVTDLPCGRFDACLAEFQRAGRGRRGRTWVAPFASGLCLSINWRFPEMPPQLASLSLVAGVAARRALSRVGVEDVALKWPNDLLRDGGKLGGILCELRAESAGPAYIVIGIGLNVCLPAGVADAIGPGGLPPADLAGHAAGRTGFRAELAGTLLNQLVLALMEFEQSGLAPFRDEWSAVDALHGQPVSLHHADGIRSGRAAGIDEDGALIFESAGVRERVVSGEVSLRFGADS
ncbi:MAG: biotin--[acetyl-CoA-carboxylase] ligase [Steroidobacteraceae bacterium]